MITMRYNEVCFGRGQCVNANLNPKSIVVIYAQKREREKTEVKLVGSIFLIHFPN